MSIKCLSRTYLNFQNVVLNTCKIKKLFEKYKKQFLDFFLSFDLKYFLMSEYKF